MTLPTVHLNGTALADLLAQRTDAYLAITDAICALHRAFPNGRDFYPQGPDALRAANAVWDKRAATLRAVADEINAEIHALDDIATQIAIRGSTP